MSGDLIAEFKKCLDAMSYSRAGWDFDLPPKQREEESRLAREALYRARSIWADNPDQHEALRIAFAEQSPLATLAEIAEAR